MKTITDYEVVSHGVEHEQYFQGCGTAFTDFEDVATGIGWSESEALEDALDSLAQSDWDTEAVKYDADEDIIDDLGEDCWFYVSVRVR